MMGEPMKTDNAATSGACVMDTVMSVYGPSDLDIANAAVAKRDNTLPTMTEAEYLAVPDDCRGIWSSERTDWLNWDQVRDQYMGKRTLMRNGGLEVEGFSFRIVPATCTALEKAEAIAPATE